MKVLIIEDEPMASRRLEFMLQEIRNNVQVLAKLESIASSVHWFRNNPPPDLILLDIHLADGDAFDLLEQVQIESPVVFTTAYDEYAIKAFRVQAVDYLLKPLKRAELEKALEKVELATRTKIDFNQLRVAFQEASRTRRFMVHQGQHIVVIDQEAVAYFYTEHKNLFLVGFDGKRYILNDSLENLEKTLPEKDFFRINRQFIIQLKAIKTMFPESRSRLKVVLNPPIEIETIVSTERSPKFKQWLLGA